MSDSAARILERQTRIAPFGDQVGALPCLGSSFAAIRDREVIAAGIEPGRLTMVEEAFVAAPLLTALGSTPRGRAPVRLALPADSPSAALTAVSGVERSGSQLLFDVFLDAPPQLDLAELRKAAEPRLIERSVRTWRRELPRLGSPPHHLDLPADGCVAAQVEHWVHLLWLWPALVPLELARCARSNRFRRRRSAGGLPPSWVAKDAKVHPSAYLEGSIIDSGAQVGAGCSIRNSYIGPGSRLSDFTKIAHSVFEEQTHTLVDARFWHLVSLGRGTLANFGVKDTVLGRDVFLTSGVIFWSEPIEGTVSVEHRGLRVDTGRKNLGGCAGHGSVLGARTILAPGGALPNRTTVVMRREEGVLKIEPLPPGTPACWYDASLVPVSRLAGDQVPDELANLSEDLRARSAPAERSAG